MTMGVVRVGVVRVCVSQGLVPMTVTMAHSRGDGMIVVVPVVFVVFVLMLVF